MTSQEILSRLLSDIDARLFSEDGKLPSEAKLCDRFQVARMTVRRALDELRSRGLIEKRNGVGSLLTRRALRKSGLIGLIIPDYRKFAFFKNVKDEIERHSHRINYRVELVETDETERKKAIADIRRKVRQLAVLRAEGVIFRPYVSPTMAKANQEIVGILNHAEIPAVLIDSDFTRPPQRSDCDLVAVDNIAAGRRIAGHLRECGYSRVAFLTQKGALRENANWSNRLFGLAGELALLGSDNAVRILTEDPHDAKSIATLFRSRSRPDAIVCGNDEQAAALLRTLHALGMRVPTDVAIVGFDDSASSRSANPPLTTVSQPVGKIASTAFKTLLARLRYPNNDPREIFLPAPLVIRKSTRRSPPIQGREAW